MRVLFQAALWSSRITTIFLQMSNLYPAVAPHLDMPDEESFWRGQPPADYQSLVPEALMGNLMSLQWTRKDKGFTGDLRLMWVRGVGRWLIHHLHDLLEPDGIQGPHVLLTSATSWMPESSLYNVDIRPTRFLLTPDKDLEALNSSTMRFLPATDNDYPVYVSGRLGDERNEALRQVTSSLLRPRKNKPPLLEELRESLDPDRHQVLFVTLSGDDAERAATYVHERTGYTACHVIPNDLQPGEYGLHLRDIHSFGNRDDDVLVAAELAIQRGHNILNARNQAALGAVFYLARPHPPASDLSFPLSMVNRAAMRSLLNPVRNADGDISKIAQAQRHELRRGWHEQLGTQVIFPRLRGQAHSAFVGNAFTSIYQTIGRTIRGSTVTQVFFCDAAFAPRNSVREGPRDTARTSLLVAIQQQLDTMLALPPAGATLDQQRDHVINTTLYRLAHQMFSTIQWPHTRQDS